MREKEHSKKNRDAGSFAQSGGRFRLALRGAVIVLLGMVFLGGLILYLTGGSISSFFDGLALRQARLPFPPPKSMISSVQPTFDDFVGSEVCAECHPAEYEVWKNSTHGQAGGAPSAVKILGQFNGNPIKLKDSEVIPSYNGAKELFFEVRRPESQSETFTVKASIGGGHMEGGGTQTYFSEFPDGTVRFLPFDFIRDEKVWFAETRNGSGWLPLSKALALTDLSQWPPARVLGTHPAFENCQQCHGSQVHVAYDTESKRYQTRYKSLAINCESCHGPGKRHVEVARSDSIFEAVDIGMASLQLLDKDASLKVCFQCHALKDPIDPDYFPGKNLEDHYSLRMPILGESPYLADGRIKAFGYQQNHLYSDCYLNGSMTCVDCHDPHSQSYRDINGKALMGKFDNGQCTSCHASKALNPELHSHHEPQSQGTLCTSCHMPFLQHQAVGSALKFARSDHTIPIPRPLSDSRLGIENACQKCHPDKTASWLQTKTAQWYGKIKPHKQIVLNLAAANRIDTRAQAARALLAAVDQHPLAQFSGLSLFVQKHLSPDMAELEAEVVERLMELSKADDLDLKALAMMALHLAKDSDTEIHNYLVEQLESFNGEDNALRRRWSLSLAFLAREYRDQSRLDEAIRTYLKALEILPNDPATLINLGVAYGQKGQNSMAVEIFQKALAIKPDDALAWFSLGIIYQQSGDAKSELSAFQKAVEYNPWHAFAHFHFGNYYYRLRDLDNAIIFYRRAVEIDPALVLGHFYLSRSYFEKGQFTEAAEAIRAGLRYDPHDQTAIRMLRQIEAIINGRR